MRLDETHDPAATSRVASANGHADFPIQNLPLGIFSDGGGAPRGGVAIGDRIVDIGAALDLFDGAALVAAEAASGTTLNTLLALGPEPRRALRRALFALLRADADDRIDAALRPVTECTMHLPAAIGDYTDFYAGIHHAEAVGRQFRPDQTLLPNYKHVPIGYHGRASSVRVSGTPVRRPSGQRKAPDAAAPSFGPSQRLDFELELGLWIGPGNALGEPIGITDAGAQIAGLCLLNDWSARDIQAWEYQPLGPFLAKNFLTSVSPWLVTAEALTPFRVAQPSRPEGDPQPLAYLHDDADQAHGAYAIDFEATLSTAAMRAAGIVPHRLSRVAATMLYWTPAQLVAHHTSGGCDLRPGDLFGSGTISGPALDSRGSLLEIAAGGKSPLMLPGGETRGFLHDGDELTLTATARRDGYASIGFGSCTGRVV